MALGVRKEEEEIIKPRNDKREYRRIVLQNNLHVLLISDADTDKCAASMDVRVGSFSDPEGLGGLAHFPATSAFTSSEHTNYYFDVNPDGFEEALDRFSQFFIKPLMSADATTREIKAVDSENQKILLSDLWRMNQSNLMRSQRDQSSIDDEDTLDEDSKTYGQDTEDAEDLGDL